MSWRPEGWEKIRAKVVLCEETDTEETLFYEERWEFQAFEAGADAMLGAVIHELNQAQDEKELRAKMDGLVKSVLSGKMLKEESHDKRR